MSLLPNLSLYASMHLLTASIFYFPCFSRRKTPGMLLIFLHFLFLVHLKHIPDEQFLSFRALSQAMFLKWIFERGFQSGLAECCFVFESLLCEAHKAYNKREEQANKKETEG